MQHLLFDIDHGVARLTLNRPDVLNSFNRAMARELRDAFGSIATNDEVRAVLLTGAGRAFCAGQDLAEASPRADGSLPDLGDFVRDGYNPIVRAIRSLEKPVVCAVNGVAAGAGANIALACDIVIAAKSAKFIQSFANIGLIPDSGGTWTLPRLAGQARAMGLALTGEPLTAERAEAWGVSWKCVDDDQLHAEVDALASKFASAPTRGLAQTKALIRESGTRPLTDQLERERDAQRMLGRTHDYKEGVSAFMEKRPPKF